ncbi:ATP-binding protein [Enterobacter sp. UPMP2052]
MSPFAPITLISCCILEFVSEWYKLVGNPTVADALMEQLLHNVHRVELSDESIRKPINTG